MRGTYGLTGLLIFYALKSFIWKFSSYPTCFDYSPGKPPITEKRNSHIFWRLGQQRSKKAPKANMVEENSDITWCKKRILIK